MKGYDLTPEESELYKTIEKQMHYIDVVRDDERYYDDSL